MDMIGKIDHALEEFSAWNGHSPDAANSAADNLDDDDESGWEGTGEYAIIHVASYDYPIFPDDAPDQAGEPVWILGEYKRNGDGHGEASTCFEHIVSEVSLVQAARIAQDDNDINLDTLWGAGLWLAPTKYQLLRDVSRYGYLAIDRVGSDPHEPLFPQDMPGLADSKIWALLGMHETDDGDWAEVIEEPLTVAEAVQLADRLGYKGRIIGA